MLELIVEMVMQMVIIVEVEVVVAIEEDEVVLLPLCKDQVLWIILFRYLCAHHQCTLLRHVLYHFDES